MKRKSVITASICSIAILSSAIVAGATLSVKKTLETSSSSQPYVFKLSEATMGEIKEINATTKSVKYTRKGGSTPFEFYVQNGEFRIEEKGIYCQSYATEIYNINPIGNFKSIEVVTDADELGDGSTPAKLYSRIEVGYEANKFGYKEWGDGVIESKKEGFNFFSVGTSNNCYITEIIIKYEDLNGDSKCSPNSSPYLFYDKEEFKIEKSTDGVTFVPLTGFFDYSTTDPAVDGKELHYRYSDRLPAVSHDIYRFSAKNGQPINMAIYSGAKFNVDNAAQTLELLELDTTKSLTFRVLKSFPTNYTLYIDTYNTLK